MIDIPELHLYFMANSKNDNCYFMPLTNELKKLKLKVFYKPKTWITFWFMHQN